MEKFYQNPDVNILLGLQALIIPTSSVIRVFGFTSNIYNYISISDFTVSLQLSKSQFRKLLKFINQSLVQSPKGNFVITSKKIDGQIIFFRSKLKYFLLRTCNTWVAEALSFAGFKIRKTRIITAQQLYKELIKIGKIEKILE